jgi:hypothetical protein
MAIVEDVFKNGFGAPLAVALGIAVVGPVAGPVLGAVVRPVLKTRHQGRRPCVQLRLSGDRRCCRVLPGHLARGQGEIERPAAKRRHVAGDQKSADDDLESMTNESLRRLAKERGIDLPQGYVRNDELIGMLKSA